MDGVVITYRKLWRVGVVESCGYEYAPRKEREGLAVDG